MNTFAMKAAFRKRKRRLRNLTDRGYTCLSMIMVILATTSRPKVTTFCDAFPSTNRLFLPREQFYRSHVDWNGPRTGTGLEHHRRRFTVLRYAESTRRIDERYATSDWLHNIKSMRNSTILRETKGPISTIFIWALLVSVVHKMLKVSCPGAAGYMCIPTFPHSMVVSALGLLLVFRTNSAYQRFNEGRRIWEEILSVSRNLSRLSNLYEAAMGTERRLRIARLLGAFPYLLSGHIQMAPLTVTRRRNLFAGTQDLWRRRDQESYDRKLDVEDIEVIDVQKLPWSLFPPTARVKVISSDNRPMWVCDRLSREIMKIKYSDNFTSRERSTFLSHIDKLSKAVGECERITQTAVPQNYASHALRSLTIWLGTLPFALINELGLLTAPVAGVSAWLLFGTYQIGAFIQDPFQGSLKVQTLCDAIYGDVMYLDNLKNPRESAYIPNTRILAPHDQPGQQVEAMSSEKSIPVLGESSDEMKP
jgi:predicted membrane chloride channel (bestrophin family)